MTVQVRKDIMDMFIGGTQRGSIIATTSPLPNVVMAFVIIQVLKVTRLLEVVGQTYEPVMALWGLPGESATVLLATAMSIGGGVGMCISLVVADTPPGHDATVLLLAIYLMGNPVQNIGRCLGAAGIHLHYCPLIIAICVINTPLSIWVMQVTARQGRS